MKNLASLISSVVSSAFRKDAQTHNAGHSVSSSFSSSQAHSSSLHSPSPSSTTTLTSNSSTSSWTAISRHDLYGEANKTSSILQEIPLGHAHSPASHCDYCGHHPSNTPFKARNPATLSSRIRTLLCVPQVKRTEVPPPTIVLHPSPPDSSSSADLIGHVLPAIECVDALVEDAEIARFLSTKDEMPDGLSSIPVVWQMRC